MGVAGVGVENGVESILPLFQVVDVLLLLGDVEHLVLLIEGMLGTDDGVGVDDGLLIVAAAMGHGSAPEVDVGHQRVDSITGNVALVAPVELAVGSTAHDVGTGCLQVVKTVLQHLVGRALRELLHLAVILVGVTGIGHITESTHQIEVAQRAQGQHLCTHHLIVAIGKFRIFGHHVLSMVEHDVAVVDDLVEGIPLAVAVGRKQVHGCDVVERVVIIVGQLHQLVAAEGSPHDGALLDVIAEHRLVASVHHLVYIGLGLPELRTHDAVGGIDGQEVVASCEGRKDCGSAAAQQTVEYIFFNLGNHNSLFLILSLKASKLEFSLFIC